MALRAARAWNPGAVAITGGTIAGITSLGEAATSGGTSDVFLTRHAAKQFLVSGDGTGAAGANQGWIIGWASNNISGLWSSALGGGAITSANAALSVDNSGNSSLGAPTGATTSMSVNGTAVLTVTSTSVTSTHPYRAAAPVTETNATHSVAATTTYLIGDRATTITVTLPAANLNTGRQLWIRTIQAATIVSDASNVVPRVGGAAGTAILAAADGAWAMLVSDGTNWQNMAGS
jgi:hypothetical protein